MEDQNDGTLIYRGGKPESGKGLLTVEMDPAITSIDYYAFMYWKSMTSIAIPSLITTIEKGAFWNYSSLGTV